MSDIKLYDELQTLITATDKEKPKEADLVALELLLYNNPNLWRAINLAQSTAVKVIENETPYRGTQTVIRHNYEGIKKDHGYEQADALERLLIDHLALCWIRLNSVEQKYSKVMNQSPTIQQGEYWEKRLSAAHQRYLKAVESLAKIKRLRLPAMQVNIADKQVNVAGD